MTIVTLIYPGNVSWIAGSFPTLDAANSWVTAQNLASNIQVQIITTPLSVSTTGGN